MKSNGVKTDGEKEKSAELRLGIDIGSTTVKLVVIDAQTYQVIYSVYRRHHARQIGTAAALLKEAAGKFPGTTLRAAVCGSGGKPVAEAVGVPYVQEVVANAAAVCALYPQARTAVELGGQDAKLIFFHYDEQKKELTASDMRMNGSCAGGTGAFIDEIAALLNVEPEQYEALAAAGSHIYDISGRCGVFAKTDIQPLLIQGAAREDIALSAFHAIAKQTIGGLSQGLELAAPIIFEGGPLTFHPTLVKVFAERLHLKEGEILIPEHPETIVARGAAIAIDRLLGREDEAAWSGMSLSKMAEQLSTFLKKKAERPETCSRPFFSDKKERQAFEARHDAERMRVEEPEIRNGELCAYLGIDSGSTTSKMVLMDEQERVIDRFYASNRGQALQVVCDGIRSFYEKYDKQGVSLRILGVGTTGYGEKMLAKAFGADYHIVETVAHATAALRFFPEATFLLDIGGQDMKAIWLEDGVITNIMLNEACSSGCGSFLETFAESLNIPVEKISDEAFASENPARLGSRCTVFMNSTIINEQRNGKSPRDIMAGLCRSIIENVFTKVVRLSNTDTLGDCVVVQGGTFNNAAVLRALEEYLGREVHLAPYSGEMGALGAAMLTRSHIEEYGYANQKGSSFIGREGLAAFHYETRTGVQCPRCANHCSRTVISFFDGKEDDVNGKYYVTGNRCERGEVLTVEEREQETGAASTVKESPAQPVSVAETKKPHPVDLFAEREVLLFQEYPYHASDVRKEVIGLPRVLEFWDSCPFWSTFFRALGFQVR
ncbi:MAG: acyl-CoA dehydratase activase, partial [Lachnospiraceae bacterium]|nr:acyl-CoA dehydratase activase [Lachnospiraceae bacterium]